MKKYNLYEIRGEQAVYYVVADSQVNAEEAVCAKEKHFNYDQLELRIIDINEDQLYFITEEGQEVAAKEAFHETINDKVFYETEIIAINEYEVV